MRLHTPRTPQSYWCHECDKNTVDSDKPETGSFFTQHGHAYNNETRDFDGEYLGVMFAICASCKPIKVAI